MIRSSVPNIRRLDTEPYPVGRCLGASEQKILNSASGDSSRAFNMCPRLQNGWTTGFRLVSRWKIIMHGESAIPIPRVSTHVTILAPGMDKFHWRRGSKAPKGPTVAGSGLQCRSQMAEHAHQGFLGLSVRICSTLPR